MRYSEIIRELNYWKEVSGEDDPEIVIFDENFDDPITIDMIEPVEGVEESRAIGICFAE